MSDNPTNLADAESQQLQEFRKWMEKKGQRSLVKKNHRAVLAKKYKWLTERILAEAMSEISSTYRWSHEYALANSGGRQKVDVAGEPKAGGHLVLIEIEGGQSAPTNNVVKIWRHIVEGKVPEPVLLVHVFSPYYARSEGVHHTRMQEAIFVGIQATKATKQLDYTTLGPDEWPSSEAALGNMVTKIASLVKGYQEKRTVPLL